VHRSQVRPGTKQSCWRERRITCTPRVHPTLGGRNAASG
jgi:hypothetical protein